MIQAGTLIQPLINLLRDQLLVYDIMQMDETTVQVLNEPGKTAQSKSYLWVQRGGPPERPVVLFDYDPSRCHPWQVDACWLLGARAPKIQRSRESAGEKQKKGKTHRGLALIQKLYKIEKHCRTSLREFSIESLLASLRISQSCCARFQSHSALPRVAQVAARSLTVTERTAYRKQHAQPVLNKLRDWLETTILTVSVSVFPPGFPAVT